MSSSLQPDAKLPAPVRRGWLVDFSNLKIFQKGLILVGLPLLSELIFVGILVTLQVKAERDSETLTRSKAVITAANNIPRELVEGASALVVYKLSQSDLAADRFESSRKKIDDEVKKLNDLYSHDPRGLQKIAKLQQLLNQGLSALQEMRDAIAGGKETFSEWRRYHPSSEMTSLLKSISGTVSDIVSRESLENRTQTLSRSRRGVMQWLVLGVAANIVLAVGLLMFLTAEICNRLLVLSENSKLLSEQKPLHARLSGTDEIAELDDVFHAMADALKEASRKERAIIDNALDVICAVDADLRFTRLNPAALSVWGYEPESLVGRSMLDLIAEPEREKTAHALRKAIDDGSELSLENLVSRADSQGKEMHWTGHWSEVDGSLFCVVRDISERKELERRRQEFVAMLTHDLRTPLTSLGTFLEGVVEGIYDDRFELMIDRAAQANTQVARLVGLVSDMLDVEKAEAGMLKINKSKVGLRKLAERARSSTVAYASARKVTLSLPSEDIVMSVDADLMVRLLENLISNAIKFSPPEGVVKVTLSQSAGLVEMAVHDQGPGIPAGEAETIFEKFKQSSQKTVKGGTGLGLAFCKQVAVAHGGDIRAESQAGAGSSFILTLPNTEG